jgi:hypothetical protein
MKAESGWKHGFLRVILMWSKRSGLENIEGMENIVCPRLDDENSISI